MPLLVAMLASLAFLVLWTPPSAGQAAAPSPTVETIAGPGFCAGDAEPDRASVQVRAMAVAADGHTYVDTGPPGEGVVASVRPDGRAEILRTGVTPQGQVGDPAGAAFPREVGRGRQGRPS